MSLFVQGQPKAFHIPNDCRVTRVLAGQPSFYKRVGFAHEAGGHGLSQYASLQKRQDSLCKSIARITMQAVQKSGPLFT